MLSGIEVIAYPNPSSDQFTIELRSEESDAINVRVMDLQGRTVYSEQAKAGVHRFGEYFGTGIYILEVTQGDTDRY
jgi:hypothetical protein